MAGKGRCPGVFAEGALECTDQRWTRDVVTVAPGYGGGKSLNPSGICVLIYKRYIMGPAKIMGLL